MDEGTAYELGEPSFHEELTLVGRGSPMGELMRRYWQPVALSEQADATPQVIRALGEELVLFRDGTGQVGLVHPRCAHRGTTLLYGKVESDGIRCCYHGWKFGADGTCLEQPCEPGGGRHRDRVRQPWYPVREYHGLVFAYLGPPDRKPSFPVYDIFDDLADDEIVIADDSSFGSGGVGEVPCNWLQHYENVMDPYHVPILHGSFSGGQFVERMAAVPEVVWDFTDRGVRSIQDRPSEDGGTFRRVTEVVLPNLRVVANPRVGSYQRVESIGWVLPTDDTHFRIFTIARVDAPDALDRMRSKMNGKYWWELTEEEHREFPGDWEAMVGQGPITLHSEENLASSDRGVSMVRTQLRRQLDAVEAGGDPIGVVHGPDTVDVELEAGNFLLDS
jgi:nitrite reductase/ring-hydroxylating ferredoxin subunit